MSQDLPSRPGSGPESEDVSRRSLVARGTGLLMAGGLAAGYGTFAAMAGRFLYPAESAEKVWLYVSDLKSFADGASVHYRAPSGAAITIARTGNTGEASDFRALSSICPHLGCNVHWEPQNQRFFCPCHNGAFDASGKATEGPPFEAGQSLDAYPIKVQNGLLYIQVEAAQVARAGGFTDQPPEGPRGPGHDPCLFHRPAGGTV